MPEFNNDTALALMLLLVFIVAAGNLLSAFVMWVIYTMKRGLHKLYDSLFR